MDKIDGLAIRCIQGGYTPLVIEKTSMVFDGRPVTVRFGWFFLHGELAWCYAATMPLADPSDTYHLLATDLRLGHLKATVKRMERLRRGERRTRPSQIKPMNMRLSTRPEAPRLYEIVGLSMRQVERIVQTMQAQEYAANMAAYRQRLTAAGVIKPRIA